MTLEQLQDIAADIVKRAKIKGASDTDVVVIRGEDVSVTVRHGEQEAIERAESTSLGIRVFVGQQTAIVSSSDLQLQQLDTLLEDAVAMARVAPADSFVGLTDDYVSALADVDTYDATVPSVEWLQEQALAAESEALSVEGITNSEGADAAYGANSVVLATSRGFAQGYRNSRTSVSLSVIAGTGTEMERDYDYSTVCYVDDLAAPAALGKSAADKAVKRLHPGKVETGTYPVVFHPDIASRLLGSFISAVNGAAVARKSSFLLNAMDSQLFPEAITIIDDPLMARGLASKPFDAEGIAGEALSLIDGGFLRRWLLDLRSAKQLGLQSNGRATRRTNTPPSPAPTNVYIKPGKQDVASLLGGIDKGVYVTDTFGMGVNVVTGDYSQGAAGFMIENGVITSPVSEFTIASTLQTMFSALVVADDLRFKRSLNSPTAYVGEMMVAGK